MAYRNRWMVGVITVLLVTIACSCTGLGDAIGQLSTEQAPPNDTNMLAPTQSGTGGGSTTSGGEPGGAAIDPCAILTQADAEAFMGGPASATQNFSHEEGGTCGYTSSAGESTALLALFQTSEETENIPAAYNAMKTLAGDQFQDIPGVGDKAFYHIQYEQLIFIKGNWLVTLSGFPGPGLDRVEGLTTVAKAVAARLP